jgi:hypothetical protein
MGALPLYAVDLAPLLHEQVTEISDEPGDKYSDHDPVECQNCHHELKPARDYVSRCVPSDTETFWCRFCDARFTAQRILPEVIAINFEL